MNYIKHILGEFSQEERTQRCIICGEVIHNYQGAMYAPNEDGSPVIERGWQEGEFYMSLNTNPTHMMSMKPGEGEIINCNE